MLLDQNCVFSDQQAVTATAASTHTMDMSAASGAMHGIYAVCLCDEAFAGVTKLTVALQTAADADFTSAKTLLQADYSAADLKDGVCLLKAVVPSGCQRFVRGYYTVTGTGTAGKLSLFLTDGVEDK